MGEGEKNQLGGQERERASERARERERERELILSRRQSVECKILASVNDPKSGAILMTLNVEKDTNLVCSKYRSLLSLDSTDFEVLLFHF